VTSLDTGENRGELQPPSTALAWAPYVLSALALSAAVLISVLGGPIQLALALAAAGMGGGMQVVVHIRR
jgi:hypothetical protein